jgi:hypothetical protein
VYFLVRRRPCNSCCPTTLLLFEREEGMRVVDGEASSIA